MSLVSGYRDSDSFTRGGRCKMRSGTWATLCLLALVGLSLGAVSGCATQRLAMTDAKVEPAELSWGDEAVISVRLIDPTGKVKVVTAGVRELPEVLIGLNDSGEWGDKVAGDGLWSHLIGIPWDAPVGSFHWDFQAYDARGNVIKVTEERALTAEAPVEVVY